MGIVSGNRGGQILEQFSMCYIRKVRNLFLHNEQKVINRCLIMINCSQKNNSKKSIIKKDKLFFVKT
ncbi:hypothetical protein ACM40_15675 [Chryseobacterium sp. BLS98]|nr:hypothetical protein ACM40_15675 [Chryseobacterium sp. BLS98]